MRRNIVKGLLVFLLFSVALALMIYPFAANLLFENRTDSIVAVIEQSLQDTDKEKWSTAIEQAEEYNAMIAGGHIRLTDPFAEDKTGEAAEDYDSLVCMTEDGVMGVLEIPSIDLSLPVYHGTSEKVLEMGAGHLKGTSLPVGGKSTHAVLTGHSGLSHAKLFTDLAQLTQGDLFYINVLGRSLVYEVDQIKTVFPTELGDLKVESGRDYCTLVTCTPYGVNTHRLLVRGRRTCSRYAEKQGGTIGEEPDKKTESKWMEEYKKALGISFGCFAGLLLLVTVKRHDGQIRREKMQEKRF